MILNDSDAKRAAIVQRYRLMSGQPDEFIQFKAFAEMSQRRGLARFDPRLYQYGGLWIYPVGALVRGAIAMNLIERPSPGVSAREFYLDRPDAFGSFYVIARGYSAFWGTIAALAILMIARRAMMCSVDARSRNFDNSRDATRRGYWVENFLAAIAAISFVALPAVQTAAHEAKPHLAGAALCLFATIAAVRFVETGRRRWLVTTSVVCGAAMAMVVSMALSLAILPAMMVLRARQEKQNLLPFVASFILTLVIAFVVYAATNPFVLLNAIRAPQLLRSNLGNSAAMYGVHGTFSIVADVIRIVGHAMTPIGARVALAAFITVFFPWRGLTPCSSQKNWADSLCHNALLIVPAALVAIQFVLLSAGKPAEYARFGLVVWAAACITTAIAIRRLLLAPKQFGLRLFPLLALCLIIPPIGGGRSFDPWQWDESDQTALQLDTMRHLGHQSAGQTYRLGVAYEPAPWSSPPMNLFEQEVVLVRMTPAMLNDVDAVVWPVNLETQLFEPAHDRESLDWRDLRWGVRAESREGEADRWRGGW